MESTGAAGAGANAAPGFANTMVAGATATSNRFSTEVAKPNAANLSNSNSNAAGASGEAGASNQDLTKRL